MKVVVTIATLNPQHGGPARTVPALCRALVRHGADLELVTIAWLAYEKSDLKRARVLHATSENEAKDFRQRGLMQPITVVPNGVRVPLELARRLTPDATTRTLLFLSRLHPIKGLKDLVRAWAQ